MLQTSVNIYCDHFGCNVVIWNYALKKFNKLNNVLQRYNGLITRYKKEKSKENQAMLEEAFQDLKQAANEVLDNAR